MTRPVLLVSPVFHGYGSAIAAALTHLGEQVVVHPYDRTRGLAHARDALGHRLPHSRLGAWTARSQTDRAIAALRAHRPRAVLVVKGDTLGEAWWDAVAESGARVVVWLYDELRNMTYSLERLRSLPAVASYSQRDTATLRDAGVEATSLPLAFDSLTPFTARPSAAVSFVGARYPERERVLRALTTAGIGVEAYGRQWSRHPWDVARTGLVRSAGVTAHRDVSRPECYGVMAGSLATLNVHGEGHDGLSIRSFEAPGVGALALIDRIEIERHYEVGREVLVFGSDDELVDHIRHARADQTWARGVRAAAARRTAAEHTLVHRMREVQTLWA